MLIFSLASQGQIFKQPALATWHKNKLINEYIFCPANPSRNDHMLVDGCLKLISPRDDSMSHCGRTRSLTLLAEFSLRLDGADGNAKEPVFTPYGRSHPAITWTPRCVTLASNRSTNTSLRKLAAMHYEWANQRDLKCARVLLSAAQETKSWNPPLLDVLEIYIIHGNPW